MKKNISVSSKLLAALLLVMALASLAGGSAVADHTPQPDIVTVAGSLQDEVGCPGDWDPACAASAFIYDGDDDVWQGLFDLPAGSFEYKAALNGSWDENYGANAQFNGPNILLNLGAPTSVKFYYDHKSHWVTDSQGSRIATAAGSFQSELGCSGDWDPGCLRSWLQDADGDGFYYFVTDQIPAGDHEFKIAISESWDENYGAGGVPNGANIPFSVPEGGGLVTFSFDSATNTPTVEVGPLPPPGGVTSVTIAGSLQDELGCPGDWQPDCAATHLAYDWDDDVWQQIFALPGGSFEYKAALNNSWDENYGANAQLNGPNILLGLAAATDVKFYYDHKSHWVTDNINSVIATAAGDFQSELGCPGDWQPDCLLSWLQDIDGDGVYHFQTAGIPPGDYQFKIALDEAWGVSYPGDNVPFSMPSANAIVTFEYDASDNQVSVTVDSGEVPPQIADLVSDPVRDPIQDDVFYFVMPDRFDNGDPSNDTGGIPGDRLDHGFDPTDKGFFHGGDLAGLTAQLDYLEQMGTTAIWMTPVFKNNPVQGEGADVSAGYHGYWYVDMTQFDPHFGTNNELTALIDQAHARGIKIFFDIITNHTADLIDYQEGQYAYRDKEDYPYKDASGVEFDDRDYVGTGTFPELDPATSFPYTPITDTLPASTKFPLWLNDLTLYHNRGNSSFSGENSLYGDFFGLDDLWTEHPNVVDGMTDIYKDWITNYDIDGFRVDTVKHVNLEFWQEFTPEILAHAAATPGREEFFVFGEVFSSNQELMSLYTTQGGFPAVLDFGFQSAVNGYASGAGDSNNMRDLFAADDYFTDADSNVYALPTFTGSHDIGRFGYTLRTADPAMPDGERVARSELAAAMMFFSRGVPVIYYGDEQGFVGDGGDKDARQDMMPSQVPSYNDDDLIGTTATTADDNFDPTHPLYQTYSDFAQLLAAHPALQTGAQIHRFGTDAPGIYALSRIDRDEQVEYLVVYNNADSGQTAVIPTFSPDTSFTEIYPGGGSPLSSDAGGNVTVGVPGIGVTIFMAGAPIPASEAAPGVSFNSLSNDQEIALETKDLDGNEVLERIEVGVDLSDDKYAEVTFAVRKSGETDYTGIGVDDNAPYRVFFPLENVPGGFNDGDMLDFVAVVKDNAGHLSYAEVTGIKPIVAAPPEPGDAGAYAIIHYFREDGDYGDHTTGDYNDYWGLHLWGDIEETIEWTDPKPFLGEDEYGRFAWVKLQENASDVGFIVHRGDTKDGTNADRFFNPGLTPEIWLKNDDAANYTSQAAAQGFGTIRYHRDDGNYGDPTSPDYNDFWGLHLWGSALADGAGTEWTSPRPFDGVDDFGAFWQVPIQDAAGDFNFIIHRGDTKDPGPDQSLDPQQMPSAWILSGDETIYPSQGAAQGYITLHYHRPAGDYGDYGSSNYNDFWGLHTWGDAADPGWTTPRKPAFEDTFGVAFEVDLINNKEQLNYILHRGDDKDPGPDQSMMVDEWGYEIWQLQAEEAGTPNVPQFVYPLLAGEPGANPGDLSRQQAYWVDEFTILWDSAADPDLTYTLVTTDTGGLQVTDMGITGGDEITLKTGQASLQVKEKFPHLADLPALAIPADHEALIPDILTGQIAVSAVNSEGLSVDATGLQIPGVLDDLYTYDGELGVIWDGSTPILRLWAPTAKSAAVNQFSAWPGPMSPPPKEGSKLLDDTGAWTGVWEVTGDPAWKNGYYLWDVEVYVPSEDAVVHNLVTDPYSVSLAMNSEASQIVNLDDPALKPAGWDSLSKPDLVAPEDISIYEIHMRDFSRSDPAVPADLVGTYKAFTLDDTAGSEQLKALADAGLSHLHLLPVFDIATIDEDKSNWQLEDWNVLSGYAPDGEEQQAAITAIEDEDAFNWGYDPFHYTTPEGSYSTDPNGSTRIVEFREMVQAINEDLGLRVVMDVVYNHTNASGQDDKSVLDKIVPGYYHRLDEDGSVETSTCCQNTATEYNMMEKLMVDSLVVWAEQYKIDAFRFDLMGHHMKRNMLEVQQALAAVDPDIYIYGEGWNFGEVADNARGVNATQLNMAGTGIGTFSDRLRDAVRGGGPFDSGQDLVRNQGFANGLYYDPNALNSGAQSELDELLLSADQIRVGMAGNLADYEFVDRYGNLVTGADVDYNGQPAGYTQDPQEDITYVSKHDNQTLYDNNTYKIPDGVPMEDRVRIQNVGLSTVLLGQGVPFMHAGSDLLRSKSLDRDSFNSGDWFNKLDFTYQSNNFGVGLPVAGKNQDNWDIMRPFLQNEALQAAPDEIMLSAMLFQELLAMRESSPLFRLRTEAQIMDRVTFHNTGPQQVPGLIVMSISDTAAPDLDGGSEGIFVLVNANDEAQTFAMPQTAGLYINLHSVQQASADELVQTSSFDITTGSFYVPGRTTAVFVEIEQPEDMIDDLIDKINDLVDQGIINGGNGTALTQDLEHALRELADGDPVKAVKFMNDFIKKVDNWSGKQIPADVATYLHAYAEAIIAAIGP